MTTLKANHNLLLPDGKTQVKVGETFEYDGDYSSFKECVSLIKEDKKEGKKEATKTTEEGAEEKALREKARLLGIKSYHNKSIEKLIAEIEEKEAEVEKGAPNTPEQDGDKKDPETPAEGE